MNKKITSVVLAVCMLFSCLTISSFTTSAAQTADSVSAVANTESVSTGSQGPQTNVQGSAILHCFNWSYNAIKDNLADIKKAGYTAVQTSPGQVPKDYNPSFTDQNGQWWKLYQPTDIAIADSGQSWLGSKSDLKNLCSEADKYGIKVIVDVVCNHMADVNSSGNVPGNISQNNKSPFNTTQYYRMNGLWANDDNNRYNVTNGSIGQPDLNTGDGYVQQRFANLLQEYATLGVDGFRFDAAKHIELPSDSSGSQFWPTIINAAKSVKNDMFFYGEVLNYAGTDIGNYGKYMSYTDNYCGDKYLVSANSGNASGLADSSYYKGGTANKTVIWAESHDTYMGESGSAGIKNTRNIPDSTITKAWAILAARADSSALFFARPANNMGAASTNTTWKSKAVAEVNKFKNFFAGESEYLASDGDVAYVERGTNGVVISKLGGSGYVNLSAHKMKDGTYTDQVSGGTFTVSGGRISGNVDSSGVAVVYNPGVEPTTAPTQPTTKPTEPTTAPVAKLLIGDINLDDKITVDDATYLQLYLVDMYDLSDKQKLVADVSGDNDITIKDVTMIQFYLVGDISRAGRCGQYIGDDPTEPTTAPTSKNYVYFRDTDNWGSVSVYYWSDGSTFTQWPGQQMESIGNNEYRFELPDGVTKVIFSKNGQNKTPDLIYPGANYIYDKGTGQWSKYGDDPTTPTTKPYGDGYTFFKNTDNWDNVSIYYWSDGSIFTQWPGQQMEKVSGDLYRYKLPDGVTKIIFSNNGKNQTSDIDYPGPNMVYDKSSGQWSPIS